MLRADAARIHSHSPAERWFVDETYIRSTVCGATCTGRSTKNNAIEADHSQLKLRLRPMRGLQTDQTAQVVIAGHAFVQNLRRGHDELGLDVPPSTRLAAVFTELARAV